MLLRLDCNINQNTRNRIQQASNSFGHPRQHQPAPLKHCISSGSVPIHEHWEMNTLRLPPKTTWDLSHKIPPSHLKSDLAGLCPTPGGYKTHQQQEHRGHLTPPTQMAWPPHQDVRGTQSALPLHRRNVTDTRMRHQRSHEGVGWEKKGEEKQLAKRRNK